MLWHSNTIKYGLQRTQNAFQNGLKIENPSTRSQDISLQSCVTFYFGLKCNPTLLAYILAFREQIFDFKTVLKSILVPLSNIFYSIRVSELLFSSQRRRRR